MTSTSSASTPKSTLLGNAYCRFLHLAARLDSPFLLAVRVFWGWQFMITGWGKLHNLAHVTQYFTTLGIPLPGFNALFVSITEFAGGILLIAGFGTRLVGLLLALDMLVAYIVADREALASLFSNDPSPFAKADPFPFLCAAVVALVFGAGIASADYLLARRRKGSTVARG